jgi:MscS family membrane protein
MEMMLLGNPLSEWAIALAWMGGGWVMGRWVFHYVMGAMKGLASKTRTDLDDVLLGQTEQPIALGIILLGSWLGYDHLHFGTGTDAFVGHVFEVAVGLNFTWLAARMTDSLIGRFLARLSDRSESKMMGTVAPILRKTLRSTVWILGAIMALNNAGYNVGALLAGVGIGGLAMAMAAKDFVSNIFGGIAIFIDKPFVVGDRIVLGAIEGEVEEIGIRSTRLRTQEGSLITVPNHKFTDSLVENVSAAPKRQRHLMLTLPQPAGEVRDRVQAALAALPGTTGEIRWRIAELGANDTQYELTYTLAPGASRGSVHSALLEKLRDLDIPGLRAK